MTKVIGLIPLWDDDKDSLWMLPGYMKSIEACGALPLMLPLTRDPALLDRAFDLCDGLLITGGHDVDPAVYGQPVLPVCGDLCPTRDRMEAYLLDKALQKDIPVLGICRGIQIMNSCLGGTLYQDLPTQHPSGVNHHMAAPYDRPEHPVTVLPGTLLHGILGKTEYGVNSCHHQGVDQAAPGVLISALADDGLTEAIELPGKKFVLGVQWHPEFSYRKDPDAMKIIAAFVKACE